MNITQELIDQIHKENLLKGFWEDDKPQGQTLEKLANIHSKISEAFVAYMLEKRADLETFEHQKKSWIFDYTADFKTYIKNSVEDKLADTIMLILDLMAAWGFEGRKIEAGKTPAIEINDFTLTMHLFLSQCYLYYRNPTQNDPEQDALYMGLLKTLEGVYSFAEQVLKIDLDEHVKLKLEYNKSREYKHGKLF